MKTFHRGINIIYLLIFIAIFGSITHFFIVYKDILLPFKEKLGLEDHTVNLEKNMAKHVRIRDFSSIEHEAQAVPVLMYHRIVPEENLTSVHYEDKDTLYKTVMTKAQFEEQMAYLYNKGYTILNLREFYAFLNGEIDVPSKSVLLTFDDGYKDHYANVYPVLKKYKFTATSFILTTAIESKNSEYVPELYQYLSREEMLEMQDVFDFQSHTYNLHSREEEGVSELITQPRSYVEEDIRKSIEHLNGKDFAFAYPFGEYDREGLEIVKDLGFKLAFTTQSGIASPDTIMDFFQIPRLEPLPEEPLERFIARLTGE